jgi:hypothetical protein
MDIFNEFYQKHTNRFEVPASKIDVNYPYHDGLVQECLNALANQKGFKIDKCCRIYIEGRHVGPFEAKCIIQKAASAGDVDKVNWDLIFSKNNFLIFINYAALFSKPLLQMSQQFVGEFCDQFEPDGVSIEHHIIIGRYAETAFGVHVDDPTDRVFHFNLGPAEKSLRLWPRHRYLEKYKEKIDRPLSMVSCDGSSEYKMPKGSCFFLPANYYHVGQSMDGISCVIALAFSKQSELLQYNAALSEITKGISRKKFNSYKYFSSFVCKSDIDSITEELDGGKKRLCFSGLLQRANARRKSNNSFIEILPPDFTCIDKSKQYKINPYARPRLLHEKDRVSIFSGGHDCYFTDSKNIDQINNIIDKEDFLFTLDEYKNQRQKSNKISTFLSWLIATNGAVPV